MAPVIYQSPLGSLPTLLPDIHAAVWLKEAAACRRPDDLACFDASEGRGYSMVELDRRADMLAKCIPDASSIDLKSTGTIRTVGILSPNHLDFPVLVHACVRATIPFAPLSGYASSSEMNHMLNVASVAVVFCHTSLVSKLLDPKVAWPADRIIVFGQRGAALPAGMATLDSWMERAAELPSLPSRSRQERSEIMWVGFSSGTTAFPKAVVITHVNFIAAMNQMLMMYKLMRDMMPMDQAVAVIERRAEKGLLALPMYHAIGLVFIAFRPFVENYTAYFLPKFDLKTWIPAMMKYQPSQLTCVPSMIQSMLSPEAAQIFASCGMATSVQGVSCGGAYLPPHVKRSFQEMMPRTHSGALVPVFGAYGMSEAVIGITAVAPPTNGRLTVAEESDSAAPVGVLQIGLEARLLDPVTMKDVGAGGTGELIVRGMSISPGYLNNPTANRDSFHEGWLRTGDEFKIDDDGQLFFTGRIKETFKNRGLQVSPPELCAVLAKLPFVVEVAVAGMPAPSVFIGEEPWAWIVKRPGYSDAEVMEGAKEAIKSTLAKHKWLARVMVVSELPKTGTSKIRTADLVAAAKREFDAKKLTNSLL